MTIINLKKNIMKKNLIIAVWTVGIIWAVFLLNQIIPYEFNNLGIMPRKINGLIGVAVSPFLHGGLGHIISNSIPLFILTFALVALYNKIWVQVTVMSIIIGGLAVWLLAPPYSGNNEVHVGASGVIFSYIAFLIFSGVFRRTIKTILVGLVILFLYGGSLIWGVLPTQPGVSWEAHLFGAIAGVLLAWIYKDQKNTSTETKKDLLV